MDNATILATIKQAIWSRLPDDSYRVFIFGSRTTGKARQFSDVDIGIVGNRPLPGYVVEDIRGEIEDSDIPVPVDVVDFSDVSVQFRENALKNAQPL